VFNHLLQAKGNLSGDYTILLTYVPMYKRVSNNVVER